MIALHNRPLCKTANEISRAPYLGGQRWLSRFMVMLSGGFWPYNALRRLAASGRLSLVGRDAVTRPALSAWVIQVWSLQSSYGGNYKNSQDPADT